METTNHKTLLEALANVVSRFGNIEKESVGQHGEFIWKCKTHAGSVYFNHDSSFNKVWYVKASRV